MVIVGVAGFAGLLLLLSLRFVFLPIAVLILTLGALGRLWRKSSYAKREMYLYDPMAERLLTGLAIRLRKNDILNALGLSQSEVLFLSRGQRQPLVVRQAARRL
jgi:hypothetical protein